jgi:hypothetical protein
MSLNKLTGNASWDRFINKWVAIYVVEDGRLDHLTVYVELVQLPNLT